MRQVSLSPLNRAGNQGQAFVHWTNVSHGQSRARGAVAGRVASARHRALSFGTRTEGWPHEPTHVDRSEVTRQPAGAGAVGSLLLTCVVIHKLIATTASPSNCRFEDLMS